MYTLLYKKEKSIWGTPNYEYLFFSHDNYKFLAGFWIYITFVPLPWHMYAHDLFSHWAHCVPLGHDLPALHMTSIFLIFRATLRELRLNFWRLISPSISEVVCWWIRFSTYKSEWYARTSIKPVVWLGGFRLRLCLPQLQKTNTFWMELVHDFNYSVGI